MHRAFIAAAALATASLTAGCAQARIQALEERIDTQENEIAELESTISAFIDSLSLEWETTPNLEMRLLGPDGGPGGDSYEQICPEGEIAIGVVGRAGRLIDSLQVVCAPIRVNLETGE